MDAAIIKYSTRRTDHDLDSQDNNLWDAQDLYRTDPTQDAFLDNSDCAAPTRQHDLDHTGQECICPAWQIQ